MVLRRPYAFLIKHFRALHLIIFGCVLYLYLSMNDLYNLFSTLQRTATYTYVGADTFINKTVYLFALVGIAISAIIYLLFRMKKKPSILYLVIIIYFFAYTLATWYLYSQLGVLKVQVIDIDDLILYKDISLMCVAPAYVLLALTFIRGIGFNIKQFNFSKDIEDLKIADMDSSEVEVLVGQNNYKYIRTVRRSIRELKYYILENKFILSFVSLIIVGIFAIVGFTYYQKYEKKLALSEATNVDGITYTVKSAYITEYDDKGKIIKKGYKYVVISIGLFNNSYEEKTIDFAKIHLANGKLKYYPSATKNSRFYDLGTAYKIDELIPVGTEVTRLFIFEIPNTVKAKKFTFNVQFELENTLDDIIGRYKKFDINARNIDNKEKIVDKDIGANISSNILGINKFDFKIVNYSIQDTYNNKYVVCPTIDTCRVMSSVIKTSDTSLYTMLVINYEGSMYDTANITNKFNTFNKLLSNYATITYKKNGKYITVPLELTTKDEVRGMVFLSVDRKILSSPNIKFNLNFRNIKYEIMLKK